MDGAFGRHMGTSTTVCPILFKVAPMPSESFQLDLIVPQYMDAIFNLFPPYPPLNLLTNEHEYSHRNQAKRDS
jgi:hypothetical protein